MDGVIIGGAPPPGIDFVRRRRAMRAIAVVSDISPVVSPGSAAIFQNRMTGTPCPAVWGTDWPSVIARRGRQRWVAGASGAVI